MLNIIKKFFIILLVLFCTFTIGFYVLAYNNHLELIYPKNKAIIKADSTFFVGNTDPKATLTINNKPVKVYSNGSFVRVFDLKKGKNIIVLKSTLKDDIKIHKIELTVLNNSNKKKLNFSKFTPLDMSLVVTEEETALRTTPYGDRLTPTKKGVIFKTSGISNQHFKIELTPNRHGYINKNAAKLSVENKLENQILKTITFNETSKEIRVEIPFLQPAIVEINANSNILSVRADKTKMEFEKYTVKSPYIKNFNFREDTFTIELEGNHLNGYDYYYEKNNFVLRIKKPFKRGLQGKVIVIDPGHGGKEFGSIGPTGIAEKEINLKISKYLKELLVAQGAKVIMTRTEDQFVKLYDRIEIARKANADILVSIHNNALPDGQNPYIIHGTSTYYYQPQAFKLAKCIQNNLLKSTGFKDNGIRHGNFAITRTSMPVSVLVEIGFMINPFEYEKLLIPVNQKSYAEGIKNGIEEYFKL